MVAHLFYTLEKKEKITGGNRPTTLLLQLSDVFDKIMLVNKLKLTFSCNIPVVFCKLNTKY